MKSGLTVVAVCLIASVVAAVLLKQRYGPELAATQDVFLGLTYFMEANGGRMPASEEEFVQSPFVERLADGTLLIHAPESTKFNRTLRGVPIASLAPFKVRWGTDLSQLTVGERGAAFDKDNAKVELLVWPSSPPSGKNYTLLLLDVYRRIKA